MEARRRSTPFSGSASSNVQSNGRQACNTCRMRKTRCDRAGPSCGRCSRLGQSCTYDVGGLSQQDQLADQVRLLQERLAKAESRLTEQQAVIHGPTAASPRAPTSLSTPDFIASWPSLPPDYQLLSAQSSIGQTIPAYDIVDERVGGDSGSIAGTSTHFHSAYLPDHLPVSTLADLDNVAFSHDLDWNIPRLDHGSQAVSVMASCVNETAITDTLSAATLTTLHQKFFSVVHQAWPFLSEERFASQLNTRPDARPVLALSYAVALLGSTVRPEFFDLQAACYHHACRYTAACEKHDDEISELNLFQALLLIVRYELNNQRLAGAWLTLGRALRLSKMLRLHDLDQQHPSDTCSELDLGIRLPVTDDELEMEERRRSFWGLYILQGYIDTRTGSTCEFGEAETLDVRLPAPGCLRCGFTAVQMPRLKEIEHLREEACPPISPFAGCVLMVDMALKCFDHARQRTGGCGKAGFWDNHYSLTKAWNERVALLMKCLNADSVKNDPISFSLHMNLYATEIFFHETTMDEVERQKLPGFVAAENQRRSTRAAFKIAGILRLNWPPREVENDVFAIQSTFIAWPLVMALKTMSRDLGTSDSSAASDAVAHSLRTLLAALDRAESSDGYWHSVAAPAVMTLHRWEEKSVALIGV